jgi:hypothetical protein
LLYNLILFGFSSLVHSKTVTFYDDDASNTNISKKSCSMKGGMTAPMTTASSTPSPMPQQPGMLERTVTQTVTEHECSISGMSATTLLSICTSCYKDFLVISPNPSGGLVVMSHPETSQVVEMTEHEKQIPSPPTGFDIWERPEPMTVTSSLEKVSETTIPTTFYPIFPPSTKTHSFALLKPKSQMSQIEIPKDTPTSCERITITKTHGQETITVTKTSLLVSPPPQDAQIITTISKSWSFSSIPETTSCTQKTVTISLQKSEQSTITITPTHKHLTVTITPGITKESCAMNSTITVTSNISNVEHSTITVTQAFSTTGSMTVTVTQSAQTQTVVTISQGTVFATVTFTPSLTSLSTSSSLTTQATQSSSLSIFSTLTITQGPQLVKSTQILSSLTTTVNNTRIIMVSGVSTITQATSTLVNVMNGVSSNLTTVQVSMTKTCKLVTTTNCEAQTSSTNKITN